MLNPLSTLTRIDIANTSTVVFGLSPAPTDDEGEDIMSSLAFTNISAFTNNTAQRSSMYSDTYAARHLPFVLAGQIERISVTNTRVRQLHDTTFSNMTSLDRLVLHSNQLTTIPNATFAALGNLRVLDLAHNHIHSIDNTAFAPLTSLLFLNLSRNDVSTLHPNLFRGLSRLVHLDLGVSVVTSLPATLLADQIRLRWFTLTFTLITHLPPGLFSSTPNLQELYLRHNRLSHIPPNTFAALTRLSVLSLQDNALTQLSMDWFGGYAPHLRDLLVLENSITSLPPSLLQAMPVLENLSVQQNSITAVPPCLVQNHTLLRILDLSHNQIASLPPTAFEVTATAAAGPTTAPQQQQQMQMQQQQQQQLRGGGCAFLADLPNLQHLSIAHNRLTVFPRGVHLPSITSLRLNSNPITQMLDVTGLPTLRSLYFNNNAISALDIAPLLALSRLQRLEISPAPTVRDPHITSPAAALAAISAPLVQLDITNVDVRALLSALAAATPAAPPLQLKGLYLGWPGMDEASVPLPQLCKLLSPQVESVGLRNTGYSRIDLCRDNDIDVVFLQGNPRLESVTLYASAQQLNVSGCPELTSLAVPSVQIVDISRTQVPLTRALCHSLGSRVVVARSWYNMQVRAPTHTQTLLAQCLTFSNVELLDLSDNQWLSSPAVIEGSVRQVVAVSAQELNTNQFIRLRSRPSIPIMQLTNAPVVCQLKVTDLRTRLLGRPEVQEYNLAYFHSCACAVGYETRGRIGSASTTCVKKQLNPVPVVLGTVAGVLLLQAALYFMYRWYRTHRLLRAENELNVQLLSEKDAEVLALKAAWEIPFDELDLRRHIASGAYGDVWEAEWDTVHVAVKVMKDTALAFDEGTQREFEKEVDFLQRTRHPHLVRFFGAGKDDSARPFLVLEFVALGSLRDLLRTDLDAVVQQHRRGWGSGLRGGAAVVVPLAGSGESCVDDRDDGGDSAAASVWDLKLQWMQDVACGMAFIHSLAQFHRDLKGGNVLVSSHLRAKITDFGTITQHLGISPNHRLVAPARRSNNAAHSEDGDGGGNDGQVFSGGDLPYSAGAGVASVSMNLTAAVGTPLYMAPEALLGKKYNAKADVFSFGVLMWEVATQRDPDLILQEKGRGYCGPLLATLSSLLEEGKRLKFDEDEDVKQGDAVHPTPEWYRDLAYMCMAQEATRRPSFPVLETRLKGRK
ncbi:TKL protein kinase [Salpingoeca rosetta]|uniref:TKL protein kinase n=1 Tax=Salpingoeca rosetta (strain ATCC 50818 / BSB-021) TaxID=946362 RepID=F2UFB1_SALR5|nr:TKL protein kinase [Salpingoeca rosetta]EGD75311.1 TKL protein kinase [Salpingoeca rosetta]|eukprot:XP_004992364.1 TKL protein kinase [Salpingoeca rosetta]